MNLTDKVSIPAQVMTRMVGDELVLLDLAGGAYYGLDPVGARMWELLAQNWTLSDVCEQMAQEYEVERATLEEDVKRLVDELSVKGLIQRVG